MLRNFFAQSLLVSRSKSLVLSVAKPITNSIHTSQYQFQQSNQDEENELFQSDKSSGIKNLEKLGIAKPHWSWPKYNRTIFPPSEDGVPLINPVFHKNNYLKFKFLLLRSFNF